MTSVSSPLPRPTSAQSLGYLLAFALVIAGYSIGLRVVGRLAWSAAVWQAVVCALVAGPILLTVIIGVSIPKKLARYSVTAYNALAPLMLAYQYAFPWVAWSVLIWWMNGGQMASGTAWQAGAAVTLFSYVGGAALVLFLRPRPTDIEVTRLEIQIPDLPPAFDGYRILHVSDLHAGSRMSLAPTEEKLARASGLSTDLVVFTGDLAARSACIASAAEALANVEAPDGIIAVLGNHDHWIGEDRVARALSERGITVLGNSNLRLTRNGDALWFVGVKDCSYIRRDDFPRALEGVPEDASPVVITHSPDLIYQPESSRAAVVLAGHTHGGQLVFPWIGPLYVPTRLGRRRMSGLLEVDGRRLFINRGLGEVTLPMRLNCPPELALLTLRRRPT